MFRRTRWGAVFLAPALTVATLAATPVIPVTAAHAVDAAYERVLNGTFDSVKTPWWSSGNTPSAVDLGRLCADVPAGTVNVWDSMIGQNDIPTRCASRPPPPGTCRSTPYCRCPPLRSRPP
jgi:endoglucanase